MVRADGALGKASELSELRTREVRRILIPRTLLNRGCAQRPEEPSPSAEVISASPIHCSIKAFLTPSLLERTPIFW